MQTPSLAAEAARIFVTDAFHEAAYIPKDQIDLSKSIREHNCDSLDEIEFVIALEEQPARDVAGQTTPSLMIVIPEDKVVELTPQPLSAWVEYMRERIATRMNEENTRGR